VFVQETFFSAFVVLHIRDFILESTVVSLYPVAVVIADNFLMSKKNIIDKKFYVKPIIGISAICSSCRFYQSTVSMSMGKDRSSGEKGTIHGAANRDFTRAFLRANVPASEQGRLVDADGKLNQDSSARS